MADYLYEEDGKVHTRYSEIAGCTEGSIDKVVDRRLGLLPRVETEDLSWGTDRHEMWETAGNATGSVPSCFDGVLEGVVPLSHVEQEFVVELYEGVVVHMRPDAVAADIETIFDYKTVLEPEGEDWSCLLDGKLPPTAKWRTLVSGYQNSRQLKFYAFMLGLHGIRIRRGIYLLEVWNRSRTTILGYYRVEQEYRLSDLAKLLPWARDRIALLVTAVRERQQE